MIISWAGQKGGAGKSTLAIATAAEFYRLGYRTLLVDADVQGTAATWGAVAMEKAEEQGEEQGEEGEAYTFPSVITMRENLYLQLPGIAAGFDVTIIDCPGRIDSMQRAALLVSVPVTPDTSDLWALHGTLELVGQTAERFPNPPLISPYTIKTPPTLPLPNSS